MTILSDMGICMKTTVDIPDALLEEAKNIASIQGTTVRSLIEEGLRRVLEKHKEPRPFKLRKVTFKGKGLHSSVEGHGWDRIRELAYEGRGG